MDDTKASRILWVKCATSAECQTIRIAVSTVKDSWVTALGLRPLVFKPSVCEMMEMSWIKSKDLTRLRWVGAHSVYDKWVGAHSIYVDICDQTSWLLEFS